MCSACRRCTLAALLLFHCNSAHVRTCCPNCCDLGPAYQARKRQLPNQQVCAFLILANLQQCARPWPVTFLLCSTRDARPNESLRIAASFECCCCLPDAQHCTACSASFAVGCAEAWCCGVLITCQTLQCSVSLTAFSLWWCWLPPSCCCSRGGSCGCSAGSRASRGAGHLAFASRLQGQCTILRSAYCSLGQS